VQLELRRVAPMRAANIVALLYASFMAMVTVPMFIVASLVPDPVATDPIQQQFSLSAFRWLLLWYPVMGLAFGWSSGLAAAWLYNVIASRFGGFQFDYFESAASS
jgi:hypothetical protein